ncbi:RhtB (resistance to homoserine/threonine) family protein [Sinobacterium caligoides]|uniref:RhtB (Resistance to homoserine/threonine) family protein n=1 Tax=Sinobacterium caligoides TaxID=933926 RepID=A0A3N2DQA9_9GAMM|nr:LysE family translocator [Sinobacterium caligoides]ROS02024.1 RhtB (resistance to homoserine/threonine) family protein [Sinobacterium caligoides]
MEVVSLLLIGLLIVVSPGADFVLVLKNSMTSGRAAGVWTALGIGLAIGIHIAYSMFGISYIISHNPLLFSMISFAGAGYLVYLGVKSILTADAQLAVAAADANALKPRQYFFQGFLCNALNPKTMLFFVSLFSQLLSTDAGSQQTALWYGLYIALLHALWFSAVAVFFTAEKFQRHLLKIKKRLNQACGVALMTFGVVLAAHSSVPF